MTFFQQQDRDSLVRFLGTEEILPKYANEYLMRLKMFHTDGNSGPLGTVGLIDLLRFCGFKPKGVVEEVALVDWDKVPRDTRVEAQFGGWQGGVYLGYGPNRSLCVRLDNDEFVKECRRDMVRLEVVEPVNPIADIPMNIGEVAPETIPQEPSDWEHAEPGATVWVELGDDVPDGTFVSLANDGQVVVLVNGVEYTVAPNQVTLCT